MPLFLSNSAADAIANVVRKDRRAAPARGTGGPGQSTPTSKFYAEIIAESTTVAGDYSWKKVHPGATFSDAGADSGSNFNARDLNETKGLAAGTRVELTFVGYDADGNDRYIFNIGGGGGIVPVRLQKAGGTGGDRYYAASYFYNVYAYNDSSFTTILHHNVFLWGPRRYTGLMSAATYGFGCEVGGTFILLYAAEIFSVRSCSDDYTDDYSPSDTASGAT